MCMRATIKAHRPSTQPPSPLRNPGVGLRLMPIGGPLWSPGVLCLLPCFFNNLCQNPDSGLNVLRLSTTVSKAQVMFPITRIHKEPFTCRYQYTFLQRNTLYFLSKDILWQTEPDEKADQRACPLRIRWHILA